MRLAGELADGLLLDSVATLDAVRAARAAVDEVRGDRPFQVVLNLLVDDLGRAVGPGGGGHGGGRRRRRAGAARATRPTRSR